VYSVLTEKDRRKLFELLSINCKNKKLELVLNDYTVKKLSEGK